MGGNDSTSDNGTPTWFIVVVSISIFIMISLLIVIAGTESKIKKSQPGYTGKGGSGTWPIAP